MDNSWFDIEVESGSVPSPLTKAPTFRSLDIFAEPPDTTSEFARVHAPEYADALEKAFLTHSMEPIQQLRPAAARTVEKRAVVSRDYFLKNMRAWLAKGEDIRSFIFGSHESIREELLKIAREERLL